jgi:prepilin-type N-terminal cleavage/methylation domain-containing protein
MTRQHRSLHRRRGVGLVEMLVALAISAALLTSVAVALDASFKAYAANQQHAQLMQRARLAMNRIITCIRSTDTHAPTSDEAFNEFRTGHVVEDTGIEMMLDDVNGISFQQVESRLEMTPFTMSGGMQTYGTARTLLEGVGENDFFVRFQPLEGSSTLKLKRASIKLTVRTSSGQNLRGEEPNSDESVTLSTSIMPRKNLW